MKNIRRHLTYANVAATLALVVALSGSAYAANLITSRQIKNGTIQNADIHNHTIKAGKLSRSARSNVYTIKVTQASMPAKQTTYPLAALQIPGPGRYVLIATMTLDNNGGTYNADITCLLKPVKGNSAYDTSTWATMGISGTPSSYANLALQAVHRYKADAVAEVDCTTLGTNATEIDLSDLTFTAISVDSITKPVA